MYLPASFLVLDNIRKITGIYWCAVEIQTQGIKMQQDYNW